MIRDNTTLFPPLREQRWSQIRQVGLEEPAEIRAEASHRSRDRVRLLSSEH